MSDYSSASVVQPLMSENQSLGHRQASGRALAKRLARAVTSLGMLTHILGSNRADLQLYRFLVVPYTLVRSLLSCYGEDCNF